MFIFHVVAMEHYALKPLSLDCVGHVGVYFSIENFQDVIHFILKQIMAQKWFFHPCPPCITKGAADDQLGFCHLCDWCIKLTKAGAHSWRSILLHCVRPHAMRLCGSFSKSCCKWQSSRFSENKQTVPVGTFCFTKNMAPQQFGILKGSVEKWWVLEEGILEKIVTWKKDYGRHICLQCWVWKEWIFMRGQFYLTLGIHVERVYTWTTHLGFYYQQKIQSKQ